VDSALFRKVLIQTKLIKVNEQSWKRGDRMNNQKGDPYEAIIKYLLEREQSPDPEVSTIAFIILNVIFPQDRPTVPRINAKKSKACLTKIKSESN
jgi:hypothetical protein